MKQLLPLQNFRASAAADLDVVEKAGEAAGRAVEVDADADAAVVRKREIRVAAQIDVQRDREVARGRDSRILRGKRVRSGPRSSV